MPQDGIKIYARLKPVKRAHAGVETSSSDADGGKSNDVIGFNIPRDEAQGYVNNKKDRYAFQFNHVFDQAATQDAIFEGVARPVVDR